MTAVLKNGGAAFHRMDRDCAAVDSVVEEMKLASNREQLTAFKLIAQHVLTSDNEDNRQLLMHVSGVGGTGKSHLIKLIVMLFDKLDKQHHLLLGAPTGIAAVLIKGHTLHSLILSTPTRKSSDVSALVDVWRSVRYLIIDEVSMVGARFLSLLSSWMRIAKGDDASSGNKPFGGVNVIFMGDFGQLKPPKQYALYLNELVQNQSFAESRNEKGISAMNGAFLWRQVDIIIELVKNQCHAEDVHYAEFLSRLRIGECVSKSSTTLSDLEYIRSRLIDNLSKDQEILCSFSDAPIIVGSKALRDVLNVKLVHYHATRMNKKLAMYYAMDTVNRSPVGGVVREELWSIPSSVN